MLHFNHVHRFQKLILGVIVGLGLLASSCVHLVLSPRQIVVKSALEEMCQKKSVQSLLPYVTDDLRLMLELSDPLVVVLEKVGVFRLSDEIAIACQDTSVKFASEIKVTDDRYLVRLSSKETPVAYEFVVVNQHGDWKISSLRR